MGAPLSPRSSTSAPTGTSLVKEDAVRYCSRGCGGCGTASQEEIPAMLERVMDSLYGAFCRGMNIVVGTSPSATTLQSTVTHGTLCQTETSSPGDEKTSESAQAFLRNTGGSWRSLLDPENYGQPEETSPQSMGYRPDEDNVIGRPNAVRWKERVHIREFDHDQDCTGHQDPGMGSI